MAAESLGVWLKRLRAQHDLTQELLAEQACCAAQTIRMIESGRRRPSREMAERLADVLQVPADDRDEFLRVARAIAAPLTEPTVAESRLPYTPNTLIGRDQERTAILRMLSGAERLVVIVGPGGAGKTRLAIEVVRDMAASIPSVWVDLTPLTSAHQIPTAISRATGVSLSGSGSPLDVLVQSLRDQDLLLVLDNLEHLIRSGANDIIRTLLSGTRRLQILVTSRARPQLAGERIVGIAGLAMGDSDSALQLFVERAAQADHTFVLDASNRQAVITICFAVGGIPLAIELAAASVPFMSPAEIRDEINRNLDMLATENSTLPERQWGPRVVFDHSWGLLDTEHQQALARLSVFRGGWTRQAASEVAGAPLATMTALVNSSLVNVIRIDAETTRYAIHELVRQLAAEQLARDIVGATDTRLGHARYFAQTIGNILPVLQTADQSQALRRIEPDLANIRAAWEFALEERRVDLLGTMGYALTLVHEMRGTPREAVGMLESGVVCLRTMRDQTGAPPALDLLYGQLLTGYGWLQGRSGNVPAACDLLGEAVEVLSADENMLVTTPTLGHLGLMLFQCGRILEARTILERGIRLLKPRNATFFLAMAHVFLSFVAQAEGNLDESKDLANLAVAYANASGSQRAQVLSRAAGAISANARGDTSAAMGFIQEGMAISIANRDRWGLAFILTQLGEAAFQQGDHLDAGARLRESIDLLEEIGEPFNHCRALITLGTVEHASGNAETARTLWSEALHRARAAGLTPMTMRATAALESAGMVAGQGSNSER